MSDLMFRNFFAKFPPELSERFVIEQIHEVIECAKKHHSNEEKSDNHLLYMAKAYRMIEAYFCELDINPDSLI